ncbi:oxidoreductase [Sodalis sp. dw_96]|uniref:oxidoreductase n=1 Tax=Sodalis sp. dw_96 TaxID=2719794 RepID=UPI001BD5CF7D|nr:oxidoreductase [Sodalis sp. dw_96]
MIKDKSVWLITGCSKGLGRDLAEQVLMAGYRVVLTARDASALDDLVKKYKDAAIALELDVTRPEQAEAAVNAAKARFGAVDVLVNNAGYGYLAAIEEGDEQDVRDLFETNVYGTWNMIKAVLPGMRGRGHGHVVNVSSVGGLVTFPAVGFYHMTKFAVEGLSETLFKELAPFGIGVTVVEPGAFRTDFRSPNSMKQSKVRLAAYAETTGKVRAGLSAAHGIQRGDPALAGKAIITALQAEKPPVHLILGADALEQVRQKLSQLGQEISDWASVTTSTDFS